MFRNNRRDFLAAGAACLLAPRGRTEPKVEPFSFFVIGDTHYLADRTKPDTLDARSAVTTAKLIERTIGWCNRARRLLGCAARRYNQK